MARPTVAIVGKPNVGKSTFFNYLIGERKSIVEDTPGVTRDRVYGETNWRGRKFTLIDTGGIEEKSQDVIASQMRIQAEIAIELSDVVVFMTDVTTGITPTDKEIALMLKRAKKKVVLVCNKVDDFKKFENDVYEFYNLGFGTPNPVSSANAKGIGDVLDKIYEELPEETADEQDDDKIKVAVIGKPNVGKSSLINKILGENRLIVSNIAGTTRDAIDSEFENQYGKYMFIDTAGLRRHSKVEENIEKYSVLRTSLAVERADVCILMIDANEGVTEQDTKIAGLAHESGKGVIIAINKWDEYEKENGTLEQYTKDVYNKLAYLSYAPIIFISAKTGQRVEKIFNLINEVANNNAFRISTSNLNELLAEAVAMVQPPTDKGRRLKIFYMTQVGTKPPTFAVFVNSKKLFHFSYERYLVNKLREEYGFKGTPIRMLVREKIDKDGD
ncbi:gTPase Der [Clostridium sp. CAG:793]|nr:gTPase Der [Clostridium sp. CAG:793]